MAPRTEFHPRASSDGRMGTSIREQCGCIAPHSSVVVVVYAPKSLACHLRRARRHLTAVVQATIVLITSVFALTRACASQMFVDRLLLHMSFERVRSSMDAWARALQPINSNVTTLCIRHVTDNLFLPSPRATARIRLI